MKTNLVGEFCKGDTSIQITGLKPGNYYNIRVLATNTANFASLGPLIRLRTIPHVSKADSEAAGSGDTAVHSEPAAVHATSAPFEPSFPSPSNRESTSVQVQTKRTASARRNSPAVSNAEQGTVQSGQAAASDEDESPEAIQRLTERLNLLRSEKERVDKETMEEEEESRRNLADLTKERDRLKQEYKEKEEASSELRKHGNYLDKLNRAAQSRKATKEKQLQQKRADRQKIKDDTARWQSETIAMRYDIEEMKKEKANIIATNDTEVAEIRKGIADDLIAIKALEEQIRVKGAQIKALEKKQEETRGEGKEGQDQDKTEREQDQAWETKFHAMQVQLGSLWQTLQQTQQEQQQAEEHLAWWIAKRARNPDQFAPIPSLDFANTIQRSRSRRNRQPNPSASTMSSPSVSYHTGSTATNYGSNVPPSLPAASPFFNTSNGLAVPLLSEQLGLSRTEADLLSGGGSISPAATDLLPSNLFREDDTIAQSFPNRYDPDSAINNGVTDFFLGHTVTSSDVSTHETQTPVSAGSRPTSILSSPHDSSQNVLGYPSRPDPFSGEQQPQSTTSASFNASMVADSSPLATSRLANLFSSTFNRQRGKPGTQEPPSLGTLKQGQSQSFPRNLEQDALDPNESRRRRGSHGNWAKSKSGLLNRNTSAPTDSGLITARTGSGRRSRLNMFAPKIDSLEVAALAAQTLSSRPSSTYSFDQANTRPSSDSQRFGWPVPETLTNRSSPLGTHSHWSVGPWSHGPSRRPSVQHGSTSNLSIGSTPLDLDAYPGSFSNHSSEQAPIGTRPQSSQRPVTPRLNPAAPTFKTLFTREGKKSAKSDKPSSRNSEKQRDKDNEREDANEIDPSFDSSPLHPRLSRDAQSITTATSTADSHDSFDRSTSGTPSDTVFPSGPKETLMQKITRKSSSSKFNVPWGKERGLFSKRAGEPSTPGEVDEDPSSDSLLGKSAESFSSAPSQEKTGRSSLSWPNMRRKSRKGDQFLSEAVDRGTEVGDDEDAQ